MNNKEILDILEEAHATTARTIEDVTKAKYTEEITPELEGDLQRIGELFEELLELHKATA